MATPWSLLSPSGLSAGQRIISCCRGARSGLMLMFPSRRRLAHQTLMCSHAQHERQGLGRDLVLQEFNEWQHVHFYKMLSVCVELRTIRGSLIVPGQLIHLFCYSFVLFLLQLTGSAVIHPWCCSCVSNCIFLSSFCRWQQANLDACRGERGEQGQLFRLTFSTDGRQLFMEMMNSGLYNWQHGIFNRLFNRVIFHTWPFQLSASFI